MDTKSTHTRMSPDWVLQRIVGACSEQECSLALNGLGALLVTETPSAVRSHPQQLRSRLTAALMASVKDALAGGEYGPDSTAAVLMKDWLHLPQTDDPVHLMTRRARSLASCIRHLDEPLDYLTQRADLLADIQALPDGERETVAGRLNRQLSLLLIRHAVPGMPACLTGTGPLKRQYDLWLELEQSGRAGLDSLSLYFLTLREGAFHSLMPCVLDAGCGVMDLYRSAHICSVLLPQVSPSEEQALFRSLFRLAERMSLLYMDRVENRVGRLVLGLCRMLCAAEQEGHTSFWTCPDFDDALRQLGILPAADEQKGES